MSELLEYFENIDPYDLLVETMHPAPCANDPITDYQEYTLAQIKADLSIDELWRISNSYIKQKKYIDAISYIRLAMKIDPKHERLRGLLGLCFLLLGETKKAEKEFSSALKINSELFEVRLWLAYIKCNQTKWSSALRNLLLVDIKEGNSLWILKKVLEIWISDATQKKSKYKNLISEISNLWENKFCSDVLTLHYFRMGKAKLEEGDLVEAVKIWLIAFKKDQIAWHRHRIISNTIQQYSSKSIHFLKLRKSSDTYAAVLEKLLHLSLLPEFFEEESELEKRLAFWKSKLSSKGSYPYAHFRYALCLAFSGETHDAYDNMLSCRDKIPASKVSFFRIDELIDWLREPEYAEKITNPWQAYFDSEEEIVSWREAGFDDPIKARRWKTLGASPEEAKVWSNDFKHSPSLAYGYYACGFRDSKIAKKWAENFSVPSEAWECYIVEQNDKLKVKQESDLIE